MSDTEDADEKKEQRRTWMPSSEDDDADDAKMKRWKGRGIVTESKKHEEGNQ
jgi:hypothetical protein